MAYVYHEKQDAALCGVHALNNLLQGRLFTEVDLMQIAHELDDKEKLVMAEMGTDSADFLKFMAEDSGNVAEDGNFSIEVLRGALAVWGLELIPFSHPSVADAQNTPEAETGFLCNLESHWLSLRKLNGTWWNLNSILDAPQRLSDLYLSAYLKQLQLEGYTIFVVRGTWPLPSVRDSSDKAWVRVDNSARAGSASQGRSGRDQEDADLARAIALSLGQNPDAVTDLMALDEDEDEDLRAAIAMSLSQQTPSSAAPSQEPAPVVESEDDDEEEELRRAIELSKLPHLNPNISSQDEPPAKKARTIPAEPAPDTPDSVAITVRLSDGSKMARRFLTSNSVGDVFAWLESASPALNMAKHALLLSFPRTKLADESASLASVGITSATALTLTDRD